MQKHVLLQHQMNSSSVRVSILTVKTVLTVKMAVNREKHSQTAASGELAVVLKIPFKEL